jgi:hypothetical protein
MTVTVFLMFCFIALNSVEFMHIPIYTHENATSFQGILI